MLSLVDADGLFSLSIEIGKATHWHPDDDYQTWLPLNVTAGWADENFLQVNDEPNVCCTNLSAIHDLKTNLRELLDTKITRTDMHKEMGFWHEEFWWRLTSTIDEEIVCELWKRRGVLRGERWYQSAIEFTVGRTELELFVSELERRVTELEHQYQSSVPGSELGNPEE